MSNVPALRDQARNLSAVLIDAFKQARGLLQANGKKSGDFTLTIKLNGRFDSIGEPALSIEAQSYYHAQRDPWLKREGIDLGEVMYELIAALERDARLKQLTHNTED